MSHKETSCSDIIAALDLPSFIKDAPIHSGSNLRHYISERLHEAGLDVVVVTASAVGESSPYLGAEVVWQQRSGGEFKRQTIGWIPDQQTATRDASGTLSLAADCPQCGQHNELTADLDTPPAAISCSRCRTYLVLID